MMQHHPSLSSSSPPPPFLPIPPLTWCHTWYVIYFCNSFFIYVIYLCTFYFIYVIYFCNCFVTYRMDTFVARERNNKYSLYKNTIEKEFRQENIFGLESSDIYIVVFFSFFFGQKYIFCQNMYHLLGLSLEYVNLYNIYILYNIYDDIIYSDLSSLQRK